MSLTCTTLRRSPFLLLRTRVKPGCSYGFRSAGRKEFSSKNEEVIPSAGEWRKHELNKLTNKFQEPLEIQSDEELQPTWKDMESRVLKRRTLTLEQRGKSGRANVRPTDEEKWLRAGLYDDSQDEPENP